MCVCVCVLSSKAFKSSTGTSSGPGVLPFLEFFIAFFTSDINISKHWSLLAISGFFVRSSLKDSNMLFPLFLYIFFIAFYFLLSTSSSTWYFFRLFPVSSFNFLCRFVISCSLFGFFQSFAILFQPIFFLNFIISCLILFLMVLYLVWPLFLYYFFVY